MRLGDNPSKGNPKESPKAVPNNTPVIRSLLDIFRTSQWGISR